MIYTFEEMERMEPDEIRAIRNEKATEYGDIIQRKYADIAAILYYQSEIEKANP